MRSGGGGWLGTGVSLIDAETMGNDACLGFVDLAENPIAFVCLSQFDGIPFIGHGSANFAPKTILEIAGNDGVNAHEGK